MSIKTPFGSSGGIDWTKYEQFAVLGELSLTTNDTYEKIVNISGAGYLSVATVAPRTGTAYIKITVDGVVVHWSQQTTATIASGIAITNQITGENKVRCGSGSGLGVFNIDILNVQEYPSVDNTSRAFNILESPIFFKSSLVVEIACSDNSQAVRKHVMGGVE